MPRKPKGTQVRTVADWFIKGTVTAEYGYETAVQALGNSQSVTLYNDGQQGWLLYLDGVDVWAGPNQVITYHVEGVDGKAYTGGTPILSGQGKVAGVLYQFGGIILPPLFPGPTNLSGVYQLGTSADPFRIRARGPLAAIKPGYGFAVCVPDCDGVSPMNVTFYYTAING